MTQSGYFFDGTVTGDSSIAPYDDSEFLLPQKLYGDFVLPNYADELLVTSTTPTVGTVSVASGAAMVQGLLYENDAAVSVAITAAANNRIDRIVLRFTAGVTQTVRITKIIGIEAANPAPPALGATDFALAWIWIPSGFNPAADDINTYDVHDERLFKHTGAQDLYYSTENLMHNSEFFGYSGGAAGTYPPDGWRKTGTPTALNNVVLTNFPNQIRGQAVRIQGDVGEGIHTHINASGTSTDITTENNVITVKGSIYITSGSVQITAENMEYSGGTYSTQTRQYNRTGVNQEFLIRVRLDPTVARVLIRIIITANSAGSDFQVGQLLVVRGYVPGQFRPQHEIVWFDYDVNDASWNATAKSDGTTTINAAVSFGAVIPPYFRGLILRLRGRDSGSSGGNATLTLYANNDTLGNSIADLLISYIPDDIWRETIAYIANDLDSANAPFKVQVSATGVLTFDATIQPIGIIT